MWKWQFYVKLVSSIRQATTAALNVSTRYGKLSFECYRRKYSRSDRGGRDFVATVKIGEADWIYSVRARHEGFSRSERNATKNKEVAGSFGEEKNTNTPRFYLHRVTVSVDGKSTVRFSPCFVTFFAARDQNAAWNKNARERIVKRSCEKLRGIGVNKGRAAAASISRTREKRICKTTARDLRNLGNKFLHLERWPRFLASLYLERFDFACPWDS